MTLLALLTTLTVTAPGDYSPENRRWNGLSYLRTTASGAKVEEITASIR